MTSIFSYVSSFWQTKKTRETNKEDHLFEKEKKFLEIQQQKLNEIVKSLHNLFANKKEEKKTYAEMSTIFGNLGIKKYSLNIKILLKIKILIFLIM